MTSAFVRAKIVQLRGLGYTHGEIAKRVNLKESQVGYFLRELNEEARKKGNDPTYFKVMGNGVLPKIAELLGKADKFL